MKEIIEFNSVSFLSKNLDCLLDIIYKIIRDNILDEEILSENFFEKLLGLSFIFNKEDEEQLNQNNQVQNISSFQRIKSKYSCIIINYLENFYSEIKNKSDLIDIFCNKLFNYKDQPKIFYNLSLVLFISKLIPILSDSFLKDITEIFQDNYMYTDSNNIILSTSSMLILSSYYFIYYLKNEEKLKLFKAWYFQLSQKYALIYFEKYIN